MKIVNLPLLVAVGHRKLPCLCVVICLGDLHTFVTGAKDVCASQGRRVLHWEKHGIALALQTMYSHINVLTITCSTLE